jgi:hypothetical protein
MVSLHSAHAGGYLPNSSAACSGENAPARRRALFINSMSKEYLNAVGGKFAGAAIGAAIFFAVGMALAHDGGSSGGATDARRKGFHALMGAQAIEPRSPDFTTLRSLARPRGFEPLFSP